MIPSNDPSENRSNNDSLENRSNNDPQENRSADDQTPSRRDVYRTSVHEDRSVAITVIEELSEITGRSLTELEPIQYDVDAEKLDWIVEGADENKVTFVTNGYVVLVYGDGTLVFTPTEE